MSEMNYEKIQRTWEEEIYSESLQDLDDLTVGKMAEYVSQVRLALTETPAENIVQADLYVKELENLEFMIRDLLTLRRNKILKMAFSGSRPASTMTIAEEEFYNRLLRSLTAHSKFVESVLTGWTEKAKDSVEMALTETDDVEYITVRFTQKIDSPFMGIDDQIYGPFEKEDVATIPAENAKPWLRDGTVIRIVLETEKEKM